MERYRSIKIKEAVLQIFRGLTGKAGCVRILLVLLAAGSGACWWYTGTYDPLYASIDEDPCYQEGTYYIYDKGDYVRFNGYLNRARKEEPENEKATAVNAVLMQDIDMNSKALGPLKGFPLIRGDIVPYRVRKGHPYIRQGILNYAGIFDGNGYRITWYKNGGNGMFICLERGAVVKNLTFYADSFYQEMDEYGVGMLCMVNYGTIRDCRTEGSIEGTECYVGGLAGMNRGTIEGCVNRADVTLTGVGDYGAGGIAGLSKCKVLSGESEEDPIIPVIENCINYGSILAPWEAGGICAGNDCANIYSCGNEGDVTVQYQRGYIYPDHPDWYECAMAAGICGDMGWNFLEDCYNTGRISILEEGSEATYGIAGGTLTWVNTVAGCVNLRGTASGRMRHESVMELDEEDLKRWKEDPKCIPYVADNWQFDLEEAKEKLPLVPLGVAEDLLTEDREDAWLCSEFCLRAPEGYSIREVSPYALCMEENAETSIYGGGQVWLLRLEEGLTEVPDDLEKTGKTAEDAAHEIWLDLPGAHWLHPGYSYADDCHVERTCKAAGERALEEQLSIIHYRDDPLAALAVRADDGRMTDNVAVLPITGKGETGQKVRWLFLFTREEDNARPDLGLVRAVLRGFICLPAGTVVEEGDCLSFVAKECTGDGKRYPELAAYNALPDADHIETGQILLIPPEWILE